MFPPMPGGAGASPPQPQAPSNPSSLVPQEGPGAGPSQAPSPEQQVEQYMIQIRTLHAAIDALASQFPAASKPLRDAKQSLTDSMTAVAGSISSQAQQPRTF